jgi:predicted alpha/beta-fold hydrolase
MKKLISRHKDSVQKYTNLDFDALQNITYLYEFDRAVQCETWGYPTEDSYYRDASTTDALMAIRVPYFALSAADDPIAVDEAVPYEEIKQNPYTVLCSTSLGGHLSWFEVGGGRWLAKPVWASNISHGLFND